MNSQITDSAIYTDENNDSFRQIVIYIFKKIKSDYFNIAYRLFCVNRDICYNNLFKVNNKRGILNWVYLSLVYLQAPY